MIREARGKSLSPDGLHSLGIEASRKNAAVLARRLSGKAAPGIPRDAGEVKEAFSGGGIVVAGGFRPGQTTDAVTVQSALAVGAGLVVIGTDVKGVYDRDPKRHAGARLIKRLSPAELAAMSGSGSVDPGKNTVVDSVAASLIMKSGVRAVVLDISDLDNLIDAVEGRRFEGTLVA
jgi:uridylate kinase